MSYSERMRQFWLGMEVVNFISRHYWDSLTIRVFIDTFLLLCGKTTQLAYVFNRTGHNCISKIFFILLEKQTSFSCKQLHLFITSKITRCVVPSLAEIYRARLQTKSLKILKDPSYPANCLFNFVPSHKRQRSIKTKTTRFQSSAHPEQLGEQSSILHFRPFVIMKL